MTPHILTEVFCSFPQPLQADVHDHFLPYLFELMIYDPILFRYWHHYKQDIHWRIDLSTPYIYHSELQVFTALLLFSAIYRSSQHMLSLFQPAVSPTAIPWQWLLAVEILQLPALMSCLHNRPCRTLVNCQLKYEAISSEFSLQSLTQLPSLN
jgi:hypothetical protein